MGFKGYFDPLPPYPRFQYASALASTRSRGLFPSGGGSSTSLGFSSGGFGFSSGGFGFSSGGFGFSSGGFGFSSGGLCTMGPGVSPLRFAIRTTTMIAA